MTRATTAPRARAPHRVAIVGTVGLPASYGGFETLVENLARHHRDTAAPEAVTVYCSGRAYRDHPATHGTVALRYVPLHANGAQSIPYDMWSMLSAVLRGTDTILILGVSGTLILPLIRAISRARILTNIDGIEWKRDKWGRFQRALLKLSEALAVRLSHRVIADNGAIADYVRAAYGTDCAVIAYGGDHAVQVAAAPLTEITLPARYAFNLCRIEPENNVHMMLEAFAGPTDLPLVCVGNWDRSAYGTGLRARYRDTPGLHLLDPIYDIGKLRTLRAGAVAYIHGHSAGGTNPSLVEAMHFGMPVYAYDCSFNRHTTEGQAIFFGSAADLRDKLATTDGATLAASGAAMLRIAQERYTWVAIGSAYFDLIRTTAHR